MSDEKSQADKVAEMQKEMDQYNGLKFETAKDWAAYIGGSQYWSTFDCEYEIEGSHHVMTIGFQNEFFLGGTNKLIILDKVEINTILAAAVTVGARITIELGFKYEWTGLLTETHEYHVQLRDLHTRIHDVHEEASADFNQLDGIRDILAEEQERAIGAMEESHAERVRAIEQRSRVAGTDAEEVGEDTEALETRTREIGASVEEIGEEIETLEERVTAVGARMREIGAEIEENVSRETTGVIDEMTPGVQQINGVVSEV